MSALEDRDTQTLKLRMMLAQGKFPNPDGSYTEVSPDVASKMLQDIEQGTRAPVSHDDDGLDYDGGPA
jgi:hypothetical protein